MFLGMCHCVQAKNNATDSLRASSDSLKAAAIDAEAEDDGFIRASLLTMTEGKPFYSVCGHVALRLECPSKDLDYCFSFEVDMRVSSNVEVFTRKAKAGFFAEPTKKFLAKYSEEGRGVTVYELNLTPKQKQTLWRVLDTEAAKGSVWAFDCTTVNCTSMLFYALGEAVAPGRIDLGTLPAETTGSLAHWEDYVMRQSPWVRVLLHAVLFTVDEATVNPEDLVYPEMLAAVLPKAQVVADAGNRPLIKGKPTTLIEQTWQGEPFWLRPWMAGAIVVIALGGTVFAVRNRKNHSIGKTR